MQLRQVDPARLLRAVVQKRQALHRQDVSPPALSTLLREVADELIIELFCINIINYDIPPELLLSESMHSVSRRHIDC